MKKLRAFFGYRVGLTGATTLAQVFIFSGFVVFIHAFFFQSFVSALPIVLAGGLISLQPNDLVGRAVVKKVVGMFAFGCALAFVMTLLFPITPLFYVISLCVGTALAMMARVKPFPILAFIPLNLCYWSTFETVSSPVFALLLFVEITAGGLLALLVNRFVRLSLRKSLSLLYDKYATLLQVKGQKFQDSDQSPATNRSLALLTRLGVVHQGYIKEYHLAEDDPAQLEKLNALHQCATQVFFTLQVMRDAPAAPEGNALFDAQLAAFTDALRQWKEAAARETA